MTTTPFTTFKFAASGGSATRTMPDRLAEVHNVVDFGADPTFANDSTSAIQAAVDWTSGANRGTIYFPIGNYKVSAPITFNYAGNLSIHFLGAEGATIVASPGFDDFVFKRKLGTPNNTTGGRIFEKLQISNPGAAGGGICLGSTDGGAIRDCGVAGFTAITTEDAVGVSSTHILIENCDVGGPSTSGTNRIIIGGGGAVLGCHTTASYTGLRAYGSGLFMAGNRIERCGTAFLFGLDPATIMSGCRVRS